jgi:DNA-binding NarL/FixJ family response regulator
MSAVIDSDPIRIGLVADEPIRLAGLVSIFDQPAQQDHAQLLPVPGTMEELLGLAALGYLVVDLNSSSGGVEALDAIRRARPDLRLIVIGPKGDEELVMNSIIAGARAYLDLTAGPEVVRNAIEVVTDGSIWAPRRLLSRLIDRLLNVGDAGLTASNPQLTARERQVLELIQKARSNREIAEELGIEARTVKAYVGRLKRKTGADNRIKLSMLALNLYQAPQGEAGEGAEAGPVSRG